MADDALLVFEAAVADVPRGAMVAFVVLFFLRSSSLAPFEAVPKPKLNLAAAVAPNANFVVGVEDELSPEVEPGLGCSQHAHFVRSESLRVIQASHSHLETFC